MLRNKRLVKGLKWLITSGFKLFCWVIYSSRETAQELRSRADGSFGLLIPDKSVQIRVSCYNMRIWYSWFTSCHGNEQDSKAVLCVNHGNHSKLHEYLTTWIFIISAVIWSDFLINGKLSRLCDLWLIIHAESGVFTENPAEWNSFLIKTEVCSHSASLTAETRAHPRGLEHTLLYETQGVSQLSSCWKPAIPPVAVMNLPQMQIGWTTDFHAVIILFSLSITIFFFLAFKIKMSVWSYWFWVAWIIQLYQEMGFIKIYYTCS